MKKIAKKVCVCFCALSMGLLTTGCDENSPWLSGITGILSELLGITSTGGVTYTGNATINMYTYNSTNNTYNTSSKQTVNTALNVVATTEQQADGTMVVQVQIPTSFSVGGVTVSDFSFVTYCNANGVIDPDGPSYLTGGTCTYNGTAADINAACIQGSYSSTTLNLTNIYFQVGDKLFTGKFNGSAVAVE